MSPETKQRVVGIIVLVAFVALLIPFLFTSGVKKRHQLAPDEVNVATAPTTMQNDIAMQGMPLSNDQQQDVASQSTTSIPILTHDDNIPPEQQTTTTIQSTIVPSAENQTEKTDDVLIGNQDASAENEETNSPATNEAVTTSINTPSASETTTSTKVTKSATVKNKKRVVKNKKNSRVKTSLKGKAKIWSVQVGSFSNQKLMQKMVTNLQRKGYRVYLQKITTSRGPMVRVLVGRETTRDKAVKIARKLKAELKIDGRVVGHKK